MLTTGNGTTDRNVRLTTVLDGGERSQEAGGGEAEEDRPVTVRGFKRDAGADRGEGGAADEEGHSAVDGAAVGAPVALSLDRGFASGLSLPVPPSGALPQR